MANCLDLPNPKLIHIQNCFSSERTVWRHIALFRQTEAQQREYGPKKILVDIEQLTLLNLILENHGNYLYEIQTKLESLFWARVSTATICRTLRFMGCIRQVMCCYPVFGNP